MYMKSLNFTPAALLSLTGLAVSCGPDQAKEQPQEAEKQAPNVIFIMADDMGYRALQCYGQEHIETPNIDRLAEQGMRFTRFYSGSTVSAPSRSVLMTGMHTGHTTVRDNFGKIGGYPIWDYGPVQLRIPLKPADTTIAELFAEAGYATGGSGKWGIGDPGSTGEPLKQGFDQWLGFLNQRRAHTYYPPYIWQNQEKLEFPRNQQGEKHTYVHDLFTEFALEFIQAHQDEPFFLYMPYAIPHSAYELPSLGRYANREGWSKKKKAYAAMITRLDESVGKIMALLKEAGIDEETAVFFTSDNGPADFGRKHFNSNGELRGYKRDLYEGGIRVPMIARMPGTIPAGKISDAVWYFPDVMPTLADFAGLETPQASDGISIWPTLKGNAQQMPDRFLYWEYPQDYGFMQAVRWKDWKAVKFPEKPLELYNLANDASETNNLAEAHPEIQEKMKAFMDTAHTPSRYWPMAEVETIVKKEPE